jgi:hypothetical protein
VERCCNSLLISLTTLRRPQRLLRFCWEQYTSLNEFRMVVSVPGCARRAQPYSLVSSSPSFLLSLQALPRAMANGRNPSGNSPSSSSFSDLYANEADPAIYGRRAPDSANAEEDAVQVVILPSLNFAATETSIERYQETVQRGSDDHQRQRDMSKSNDSRATHENSEGLKRKYCEPHEGRSGNDEILNNAAKRQKPLARSATERLPIEMWQQVFLYLSPAMLCRCLRVCTSFNRFLTQATTNAQPSVSNERGSKVCTIDSEAIWTHSRRAFYPRMPRPLAQCSELAMLRLMAGSRCQFCDRVPVASPATTPFNTGPGPDGCRVIWPFGIRSCGKCLESRTLKVK